MKPCRLMLGAAAIAIASLPFTLPTPALADTFQIFNLGIANAHTIFGIDTEGAVVIQSATGPGQTLLYQTYLDGALINSSTSIPALNYDDGTPCTPTVSPPITYTGLGRTRCNNGHEVYFATFPTPTGPNSETNGIFTGPNLTDLLTSASTLDQVVLNSSGDFAWVDARDETIFEAEDQSTRSLPEPGTLLLLATGSLTLIATIPRRLN
jgi:hypothetical protein